MTAVPDITVISLMLSRKELFPEALVEQKPRLKLPALDIFLVMVVRCQLSAGSEVVSNARV